MAEPPPPPAGLPGQAPALDPQAGQIPPPSGGPIPAAALQPAPPLPVGPIPAAAAAGLPPAAMLMAVPAPTPQEAGAAAAAAATAAFRQHMSAAASMPDASRGSGENTFVAGHVRIQRPRSAHGTNHLARICGSLRAFCPTSDSAEIRARDPERDAAAATASSRDPVVTKASSWSRGGLHTLLADSWPHRLFSRTPNARYTTTMNARARRRRRKIHRNNQRRPGTTARSASLLIVDVLCERATRASANVHHQQD